MVMFKSNVTECMIKGYIEDYRHIKNDFKSILYKNNMRWVKEWERFGMFGSEGVWMNYVTKKLIRVRWAGKGAIVYQPRMVEELLDLTSFYHKLEIVSSFLSPSDDYDILNNFSLYTEHIEIKEEKRVNKSLDDYK